MSDLKPTRTASPGPGRRSSDFDTYQRQSSTDVAYSETRGDRHDHDKSIDDDSSAYLVEPKPTWKGKIWDTLDRPPKERRMLMKVDAVILTFASLGYFLKQLDQTNINSAFVSGMKEDLNMYGEELVTAVSIWTVGYVLGQIPCNLALTRVSPRYVIPALELGWGIATLGSYAVKNVKALYALRFLVGLFEAGFYPGIHYLLGGWYTPREIGKRAMIFWLVGSIGKMFSGILQAAAHKNLAGVNGLEGWRWLFIIDAVLTLPVAVLGFFFFPPLPLQNEKPWWLNEEEFEIAQMRMTKIGRAGKTPWSWAKVKRLVLDWHTWMLPMIYVLWNNSIPQPPVAYWLKSFNNKTNPPRPGTTFTVEQINQLPLPQTAIHVVAGLATAWISDGVLRGNRSVSIYVNAVAFIIFGIVFLKRDLYKSSVNGTLVLYWFSTVGENAGPLILSWINEICSADTEKRALLVAAANDLAYVVQAVAPNFIWKTTQFPQAHTGWLWVIVTSVLLIVWTAAVELLLWRDKRKTIRRRISEVQETYEVEGDDKKIAGDAAPQEHEQARKGVAVLV